MFVVLDNRCPHKLTKIVFYSCFMLYFYIFTNTVSWRDFFKSQIFEGESNAKTNATPDANGPNQY